MPKFKFQIISIYSVTNCIDARHSCEAGIQEKNWIPGQVRNDKLHKTYVVTYNSPIKRGGCLIPRNPFTNVFIWTLTVI